MSRYKMEDGTIVDTDNAKTIWEEDTRWDGHNHRGVLSNCQIWREKLYLSRKGRYYVEKGGDYEGTRRHVEWVSPEEAARWLLANEIELPEDLKKYEDELVE